MTATVTDVLAQLESAGSEKMRAHNRKHGAKAEQFGVPLGEIRKVSERIKADHKLAMSLWETGNIDARLLAILLIKPKNLSLDDMHRMAKDIDFAQVADWFNAYLAKKHPEKTLLREKWMAARGPWVARSGWSLTAEHIAKNAGGIDLPALLDRLEAELGSAPPEVQWTMNSCLASIGIHFPKHRKRALAIGEKLGLYRDYPVSKGCTSPFAPVWINEMVRRQG
jgi:3-methyladenine DNA glycosylase AlkD